jgi:hypothetical protein
LRFGVSHHTGLPPFECVDPYQIDWLLPSSSDPKATLKKGLFYLSAMSSGNKVVIGLDFGTTYRCVLSTDGSID